MMPSASRRGRTLVRFALFLLGLSSAGACASAPRYVWSDRYAPPATAAEYVVTPGDVLAVQVWDNDKISTRTRVRADGRITVPLLNDVPVAGSTPPQVARDLEQRLRQANLVLAPRVSVALDESRPVSVSVLGRVVRAGSFALGEGSGVAEALANAGGLTEFAHSDRIYVMRRAPEPVRIRFTFGAVTGGSPQAAAFRLRDGDVVVAE
ncbi:hypothetical protein tb265_43960 [Gemmatimonadetes bacterium T265]|nr:hypothetical protein tb265_43960 [Gemmatimonadetes bacterium T265]